MKKFTALLTLSFLLASGSIAQTPQYYNSNTGTGNNTFPFGWTIGMHVQWLVRVGEFNQPTPAPPGIIPMIYFRMATTATTTFTNLTIRLGQANITTLPAGVFYTGQLDTAYYRASVQLSSISNGWMQITLDRPFAFDTSKALIIDVLQCGASNTGMNVFQGSVAPATRAWSAIAGCLAAYSGQDGQWINFGIDVLPPICNYTWNVQTSGTTSLLYTVKAVSNMVAWAGGATGTVRRTTDGGATWGNGNPNPGVINGTIYAIEAIDANNAWCTTSPGATFIYRTTNGGVNWTQVFTQASPGFINDIKFINASTGFAEGDPVGGRWSLWKSIDGGATWDSTGMYLPQSAAEAGWTRAMIILGNTIWFGTNNTRIYKSTNLGATGSWSFGATTGQVNSYSVHFNSPTLGLMGGGTGALRTTDGGATWTAVTAPGSGNITGIEGVGTDFWYTRSAQIYRSSDSGTNWALAYTAPGSISDIDFAIVNGCPEGWTGGATGSIVRMANLVGIGNNNNEIPGAYKLEQNYPNPFNPTTTIRFALPTSGNVELKVYDVLGREAATIVNDFRQAGTYTVEFDASALSSGVYFYTLKSGDFTDTKKMLLIK